jgi:hypothetical protein
MSANTAIAITPQDLRTRAAWREAGRRVPTKARPARIESYLVPGYTTVYRDRHLFTFDQTVSITAEHQAKREQAALKAKSTRRENLLKWAETVELTIVVGMSNKQIFDLASDTHGGNYEGKHKGEFYWSNRAARNCVRHCLTNYEQLWSHINRGETCSEAYAILRSRVDAFVDDEYPQFRESEPLAQLW